MQLGLNQNIQYKGEVFHIQTEDGGLKNPVITTLLFKGGTILASRRTSYEDILKSDQLETVVKEIMAEQHKGILKELKNEKVTKGLAKQEVPKEEALSEVEEVPEEAEVIELEPEEVDGNKTLDDIIMEHLSLGKK